MSDPAPPHSPKPTQVNRLSIVIPVFNSADIVGETIRAVGDAMEAAEIPYEIILVNDGSTDESWRVIAEAAAGDDRITAIDLLRNYGQHTAVICGLRAATGDYAVTMDDDLQNPPSEIGSLLSKAGEGHDAVFGRFRQKAHAGYRRAGSRLIGWMNDKIFHKPKDLTLSNFRLLRRDLIDRMCAYRTAFPYIPGLVLMFATNPANVDVDHHPRASGVSNYTSGRILALVARILFNYSSYPLRAVATLGMIVSGASFLLAIFYIGNAILRQVAVPGWTTIVVLLAFFNGITLLILGMLGEYVVRLINHTAAPDPYYIRERIGPGE